MIFADLRPFRLRHDHAHQVVRLRVLGRDAHGIAGMMLGFGQAALAKQDQRQLVRGNQVVRVQRDDAADQRLRGAGVTLRLADVVKDRQCARAIGRQFQHVQAQTFGGLIGTLAVRLDGALHERHKVPDGLGRRQGVHLKAATAHGAQATTAWA